MKRLLSLILIFMCSGCDTDRNRLRMTYPYSTLAKVGASGAELSKALGELTSPPAEDAPFWSQIANNNHNTMFHRRLALLKLLERHAKKDMTLSDLATLLDHPTWMHRDDVRIIYEVYGWIPVDLHPRDTTGCITFPEISDDGTREKTCVYFRIFGEVDEKSLKDLLLSQKNVLLVTPLY